MRDISFPPCYNIPEVITMKDIAKNIRQLRCAKNMTQDELAEKLFVTRQTVSNYENGKSRPDVEMLARIAEVLESDINTLIYGPTPDVRKTDRIRLTVGAGLTITMGLLYVILSPITRKIAITTYVVGWWCAVELIFRPAFFLSAGWTLMQMLCMAMKWKPLRANWARWTGRIVVALLAFIFILTLWFALAEILNQYLYTNYIRGEWVEHINQGTGTVDKSWNSLPAPVPDWVSVIVIRIAYYITEKIPLLYSLLGAALLYLGFPKRKEA